MTPTTEKPKRTRKPYIKEPLLIARDELRKAEIKYNAINERFIKAKDKRDAAGSEMDSAQEKYDKVLDELIAQRNK